MAAEGVLCDQLKLDSTERVGGTALPALLYA
jgi:hypothetical protein